MDSSQLKGFISRWMKNDDFELEARWDNKRNPLKKSDFLRLFSSLEKNSQKKTREISRKIIYGGNIFRYQVLKNNVWTDDGIHKKTRSRGDIIHTEYGFNIVLSYEERLPDITKLEGTQFFRERDRTSFIIGPYSFDLTISRESNTIKSLEENPTEKYEVEIELLRKIREPEIIPTFIRNITYATTVIQDSTYVILETEKNEILKEYTSLFNGKRLKSPLTKPEDIDHKTLKSIEQGYSVTEKADGKRMVAFISKTVAPGSLYLIQHIGQSAHLRKPGFIFNKLQATILDGELLDIKSVELIIDMYLIVDILFINGTDVRPKLLIERLGIIQQYVIPNVSPFFKQKSFFFPGEKSIYDLSKQVLETKYPYEIDGLIFTPNTKYNEGKIFKWKPASMLTLDFLVSRDVENPLIWNLYVNTKNNQSELFSNEKFPNAGKIMVTKETNKKFNDSSVIEFSWDGEKWIPIKERPDKTVGNFVKVADAVFSLIMNPVTKEEITGQKEQFYEPKETSISVRNQAVTISLRNFHNWIKMFLLKKNVTKKTILFDFGSGKGGDINKWLQIKNIIFVKGFDVVKENIEVANSRLKGRKNIEFHHLDLGKEIIKSDVDADIITAFFSVHYFFKDKETLKTFFNNVSQNLKKNGLFIVTTFDAKEVYSLLKKNKEFKTDKFEIIKDYIDKPYSSLPVYGNRITVKIHDTELRSGISEYLVKPEALTSAAQKHGLTLETTGLFSDLFPIYEKEKGGRLSRNEKILSFLNRFYVFRRTNGNSMTEQKKMLS